MAIQQPSGLVEPLTLTEPLTSSYMLASVIGAAIVDAGTGGTPGAATVTGTTGTGTKFQQPVTIGAGGGVESIDGPPSIAGAYTVPPTNSTQEPVTGGGLTGAVLLLALKFLPAIEGTVSTVGLAFDGFGIPQVTDANGPLLFFDTLGFIITLGNSAGLLNSGSSLVAIGREAAKTNTGDQVVAIGEGAAYGNSGNNAVGLGNGAIIGNAGDHVIGIGSGAATDSSGSEIIAIGHSTAYENSGTDVIAIGNNSAYGNTGSNVIFIANFSDEGNSVSNTINIGNVFKATGIDAPSSSNVALPGSLTVGGNAVTSGHGAQTAVAGAATLDQGSGIITSEALVGQVAYTLTLTNNKILATSTVLVNATNSANLPVTVNTITEANGSVVILVGMAALTGTVIIRFAVFN